jgi:hypothetical protein
MTFTTLVFDIRNELRIAANRSSEKAENSLRNSIDEHVYARASSGEFRTGSLKNSVDSTVENDGDEIVVSVFNNTEKMTQDYPSVDARFPQDNKDNIVLWLNDGHRGIWDYNATNFIEHARDAINISFETWLKQALMQRGIKLIS